MYLKKKEFYLKSAIFMFSLLLFTFGCKQKTDLKKDSIAQIQKKVGIPVRVLKAETSSVTGYELLGGTIEGYYQTTLFSSIPGKIAEINGKVGDDVKQNSSLMTIEPDMAQNYNLVKTQFETNKRSRERVMALAEQGGISQEITDQVDAEYLASKEGLDAMRKNQFVPAPFTGTIVNLFQTINNKIMAGDMLLTVANMDKIRIPMAVSDLIINKFKVGQKAIAVNGSDSVYGVIENVALSAQKATHAFIIEAVFNNPGRLLKPGMYLSVKVITNKKNNVVTLPSHAVNFQGEKKFVFVINDFMAKKVTVNTGIEDGEMVEIVSGILPGDQVVISGAALLADGSRVNIVQ